MFISPLPTLKSLIEGFTKRKDLSLKIWNIRKGYQEFRFSRSCYSLAVALETIKDKKDKITLWVPDYFCEQSLHYSREVKGVNFCFYPITEEFSPDWEKMRELASTNPPDALILVHYFGMVQDFKSAQKFCKKHKTFLIEDCAHLISPNKESDVGKKADFVFYSPHKFLAVPHGGVMLVNSKTVDVKKFSEIYGSYKVAPTESSRKWLTKRVIQKLLPRKVLARVCSSKQKFTDPPGAPEFHFTPLMNGWSGRLISRVNQKEIDEIKAKREKNYGNLRTIIKIVFDEFKFEILNFEKEPYLFVVKAINREVAINLFEAMKSKGLIPMMWSDLSPEVLENPSSHQGAIGLRNRIITISIHQSLNMLNEFRHLVKLNSKEITVHWGVEKSDWESVLNGVHNSNLLQLWEYGEAKFETEGKSTIRGVFYEGETPVAAIQVMRVKSIAMFNLYRVNRGPIFLTDSPKIKALVYKKLRESHSALGRGVMVIAPELELNQESKFILNRSRYLHFKESNAHTIWVDLTRSVDELRGDLKSKWRNLLKKSESSEVELEVREDEEGYRWMLDRYVELMESKGFCGVPLPIAKNLLEKKGEFSNHLVLRALHEGEVVGGVLIARHHNSATYLIGWNGDKGRDLNANNFLLWNALIEMKKRGCESFDLGGLGIKTTPHIAHFKRGVSDNEYHLVGEYLTWIR